MTYTQQLQAIINQLTEALADSKKFDQGVDAAGRRLRATAQQTRADLKELRLAVQAERNSRKAPASTN